MNGNNIHACPRNQDAVGWVMHALEPAEEAEVARHVATCPSCSEIARDTEQVLGVLGASVEQVDPPPRLRESILTQTAQTPQTPPPAEPAEPTTSPEPARPGYRGPAGPAGRGPQSRRHFYRRRRLIGVSLALVAVLGVSGLGVYTAQVQQQRDAEMVRAQSLADLLVQSGQPGTSSATLATDDGRPVAAVLVADGRATVVTTGLAPNDRASTIYVVWGTGTGAPRAIGSFDAGTDAGVHQLGAAGTFPGYAISLEPGRAMPAAPTTVVAAGEASA